MSKLTITESVKVIPVSESKLRRDMKAGVVSHTADENGKKFFDTSELRRVYGELTLDTENGQVNGSNQKPSETGHDSHQITALLEERIQDLQAQLDKSEQRESELIEEKKELREMLKNEQARTLALSPPAKPSLWQRLTGR